MFIALSGLGFILFAILALIGCVVCIVIGVRIREGITRDKESKRVEVARREALSAARDSFDNQLSETGKLLESLVDVIRGGRVPTLDRRQKHVVNRLLEELGRIGYTRSHPTRTLADSERAPLLRAVHRVSGHLHAKFDRDSSEEVIWRQLLSRTTQSEADLLGTLLDGIASLRNNSGTSQPPPRIDSPETSDFVRRLKLILEQSQYFEVGLPGIESRFSSPLRSAPDRQRPWTSVELARPGQDTPIRSDASGLEALWVEGPPEFNSGFGTWRNRLEESGVAMIGLTTEVQLTRILKHYSVVPTVDFPQLFAPRSAPYSEVSAIRSESVVVVEYDPPSDADVLGRRYRHTNLDGKPDRRYRDNPIQSRIVLQRVEMSIRGQDPASQLIFLLSSPDAAAELADYINSRR
jgi:hypothetical protein